MTDNILAEAFDRLLTEHCPPSQVRETESGGTSDLLWQEIEQSGFLDAMVPEDNGGAGLGLADVFPLALLCGRHAVPVPVIQTMVGRAALASAGQDVPSGIIALASGKPSTTTDGQIVCRQVIFGRDADWLVVPKEEGWQLLPTEEATILPAGSHDGLTVNMSWPKRPAGTLNITDVCDWQATGAALTATLMAGAMERILEMTVAFSNERSQFGRPIGKFQAVQQLASVMAEQVFAARMAAETGFADNATQLDPMLAALAKARTSEAAVSVCAHAHAVHGAIGATEELDLQLFTRRLHEWRTAFGGESFWFRRIGEAVLASDNNRILDDIRGILSV